MQAFEPFNKKGIETAINQKLQTVQTANTTDELPELTLDAEEPQEPTLDAEENSQVTLSEAKSSETKRPGTKHSKEYESSMKTTEEIVAHETASDRKPPDMVQLKANQSKAKQSNASH